MTDIELENLKVFASAGAIKKGHFVYSSWRHGTIFVDAKALFDDSKAISWLCRQIAERFKSSAVNSVTGPAKGGVVIASRVAECLSSFYSRKVAFVPTEKKAGDNFFIRPAFRRRISNKRVLVVDDVLTTGGSAQKVTDIVRALGGNVVGLGALYNRGEEIPRGAIDVVDFFATVNVSYQSWSENECPLCKNRVPVNLDFGRGKEYLMRRREVV